LSAPDAARFQLQKARLLPSCAARRMAQQAAHLVEQFIPWVPTRQWVVSVPIPLRYWMAPSRALTVQIHTIVRRTIRQHDVNQAVKQGAYTGACAARLGDVCAALWWRYQSQFTFPHDFS
jgi:hypothetical protein